MKVVIHFNKGKNKLLIVVEGTDVCLEVPLSWDLNQIKDYLR